MPGPQQRYTILDLAPPWLQDQPSAAFLGAIGTAQDLLLEKANAAQFARMPGQADDSLIPFQAADRVMVQGPAESNASFVIRLQGALDAWARAGGRPAILAQIQGYLTDLQPGVAVELPECLIVGGNTSLSTWDTIFGSTVQGDAPAHSVISPANWVWDGEDRPTRAWLVLFMHLVDLAHTGTTATIASTGGSGVPGVTSGFATLFNLSGLTAADEQRYLTLTNADAANLGTWQIVSVLSATDCIIANVNASAADTHNGSIHWAIGEYPYIGPAPVWGSPQSVWGDTATWGVNCSPLVVESIRSILRTWKSAASYYPAIIVSFGGGDGTAGNEFSPLSGVGTGNPDGEWGGYAKLSSGVWVPARQALNQFTACCHGTGRALECFEENVS